MSGFALFKELRDAWGESTAAVNLFDAKLKSIQWDNSFYADGEFYFIKGADIFSTPVIDPFEDTGGIFPSMLTGDGTIFTF